MKKTYFSPKRYSGILVAWCLVFLLIPINATAINKNEQITLVLNIKSFNQHQDILESIATFNFPKSIIDDDGFLSNNFIAAEQYTMDHSILTMDANKPFVGFNAAINLTHASGDGGNQFLYPFDIHVIKMKFFLSEEIKKHLRAVPFIFNAKRCYMPDSFVQLSDDIHGFTHDVTVTISRTMATKIFAIFISILMLVIATCMLIMAVRLTREQYRPETGTLGFIAGLLFAIPAVRNLQPGIPQVGSSLIDYFGFFEAEFILVLALVITIYCWLKKTAKNLV